ncbi:DUF6415 family natural product biosynthesis protein [Streptomyces sp. NPDC014748]|uniref:DUF6415 family natural product biosynthesis protein n=1 Tax=Streptomyces sp. NPDC014748 TaxID=3364905 RepID=UPI0037008170
MGTEQEQDESAGTMRDVLQRALWSPPLRDADELRTMIAAVEGYVRRLGPRLAALAPRMRGERQATALVVLRHVDDVLSGPTQGSTLADRLHDLSVVARSTLTMLEHPGPLEEPRSTASTLT